MAIAPDGTWLATGSGETVRPVIYSRTNSGDIPPGGELRITDRAADRGKIVTPGEVRIWDRANGSCTNTLTGCTGSMQAVAIAPDGTSLATTGSDGTVRIWDRALEHPVIQVRTDDSPAACAWAPEGRGLIVGGARGLYFYDFRPGAPTRGN